MTEKDIQIDAHPDALTITGERMPDAPEGYRIHRQERRPGRFSRSFGLPCQVDLEKTKATLHNGVLTVTLEKHAAVQPRQIQVQVE